MSTTTTVPELTPEQIESFGEKLDAIRQRVLADLGERDADYIHKVIRTQRGLEVAGRGLLFLGFLPPAWVGGAAEPGRGQEAEHQEAATGHLEPALGADDLVDVVGVALAEVGDDARPDRVELLSEGFEFLGTEGHCYLAS